MSSVSSFLPLARIAGKIECGLPTQKKVRLLDPYWSAHTGKPFVESYSYIGLPPPTLTYKNPTTLNTPVLCPACFFFIVLWVFSICCLLLAQFHVGAASDVSLKSLRSIMHCLEWSHFKRWAWGSEDCPILNHGYRPSKVNTNHWAAFMPACYVSSGKRGRF